MKTTSPSDSRFLESVARYFSAGTSGRPLMSDVVFVTPNKRSALFLKYYVRDTVTDIAVMPRFMTMHQFVNRFVPAPECPPLEQLFILYGAYRDVMKARGRSELIRDFDSFAFWGEIILSDFEDIDNSLADASMLYRNLEGLKEIQADFLSPEQKEIIRMIWGDSPLTAESDRLWLHLNDQDNNGVKAGFVSLWEILGDLYTAFHQQLAEMKADTSGGRMRSAAKALKEMGAEELSDETCYVFVGFNQLTTAEMMIFSKIRDLGKGLFFWDTAPLEMAGEEATAKSHPLRILATLARLFPAPADYSVPMPEWKPEVDVIAVPSNVGQAKDVFRLLSERQRSDRPMSTDPTDTALILPDASLLIPTLTSIPESVSSVNISMGLPFRTTAFATLLHDVISMQLRCRELHGKSHFFYQDIETVLTHPHIQAVAGEKADLIRTAIVENRLYNVPSSFIEDKAPELTPLFTPVRSSKDVESVANYLENLLLWIGRGIAGENADIKGTTHSFELKALEFFLDEVGKIRKLSVDHKIGMNERTFFHLFERIFNQRGLTVSGTPLQGLQILGVLETRALDFDNLIILSMNERIFPRRQYTRTMIPNSLRHDYGLPDFDSLEWTYAYCFYRMIARSRHTWLLYDSRADGQGAGEKSRYISQLIHLMSNRVNVREWSLNYLGESNIRKNITVRKTDEVYEQLKDFFPGGKNRLSAAALKTYRSCPLSFYLKYVLNMRGSDDPMEYISGAEYGTAVHDTIQGLFDEEGGTITADKIRGLLASDSTLIDDLARKAIIRQKYPSLTDSAVLILPAEGLIASKIVAKIARADLRAELEAYCDQPFTFIKNEWKLPSDRRIWKIDKDLEINFSMSIDRMDRLPDGMLRFIDFKTGDEETSVQNLESLFKGKYNHKKGGILQLLMYCQAYNDIINPETRIVPMLHPMKELQKGSALRNITIGRTELKDFSTKSADVRPLLVELIKSIFDRDVDFVQCEDDDNCKFCDFKAMCGRTPKN